MTDARDATPAELLAFWRVAGRERWYGRDDAFDAEMRDRYLELWRKRRRRIVVVGGKR